MSDGVLLLQTDDRMRSTDGKQKKPKTTELERVGQKRTPARNTKTPKSDIARLRGTVKRRLKAETVETKALMQ